MSVLLSGARKSGKTTTVRSAAATIALDVAVVNCFELIGENDVKTEGMLRARFDRAMDAAPCVLVLENVDALARKSQSMESGQGKLRQGGSLFLKRWLTYERAQIRGLSLLCRSVSMRQCSTGRTSDGL